MWTQLFWPHNVAASAMNRIADSSWRAFGARGSRTSRKIDNTGCIGGLPNQETPSESTFIPLATAPLHKCDSPAGGGMVGGLRTDCLAAAGAASLYGGERGAPAAMTEPIAASSQAPHSSGALVSVRTRAGLVEEGLASRSGGESAAEEGETDGIEGGDGSAAGSLKYRADVGIELGAPLGAEAVGHLPVGHARAQALLGAVVGGRHGPVGEEHEQVLPAGLDRALQLLAERMGRH